MPFVHCVEQDAVEAAVAIALALGHQIVLRRQNDAPALGGAYAGRCPTKIASTAAAHLHEHQRAVALAHDKVNLAAAAPRGSIIALQQPQARRLQMGQRPVFGGGAALAGCFFTKEFH